MAKKYELHVKEGDVLAARLADGRFGAVHVISFMKDGQRRGRDSATIVTTRYLGSEPPSIDDAALRQVLCSRRFSYDGDPSVIIVDVPPPAEFFVVGNFPRTDEEDAIDVRGRYGTGWWLVQEVLLEWRWEHAREGLVREIEESRALSVARDKALRTSTPRRRTPRSTLSEEQFWELVTKIDTTRSDEDAVQPLIGVLAERSAADIREFQEILAHKLYLLDARRFAEHAGDAGESDDAFLYARCFVVAQGKKLYDETLASPERFPPDGDLESLLSAAPEAFLRRTKNDFEDETHYSYETGSNADGWPET